MLKIKFKLRNRDRNKILANLVENPPSFKCQDVYLNSKYIIK